MPQIPEVYLQVLWKAISSLVFVLVMLVIYRGVRILLRTQMQDTPHRHTLRMLVRNTIFFVGGAGILLIWLGFGSSFTVAMGILGAGIAFASQEVIGSFAGYLNIVTGGLFHIGDRVRIGKVTGDVLDISILRTTVMEIGEWVRADQYTGRVVTVANRVVFSDPVFNYTNYWPYLWDEITIPVTYASNWQLAQEIMLTQAEEYSRGLQAQAKGKLQDLRESYPIQETPVAPMIYLTLTDNWIAMTLRYVVEPGSRRAVQGRIHRQLLQRFESEPDITVASTTVEIVGVPTLRGEVVHDS